MHTTAKSIADALGITEAAVSKLKKRGMPVTSLEAAQQWRKANIKPKHQRYDHTPPSADNPSPEAKHADSLMMFAQAVLDTGHPIDALIPELRAALADVPPSERALHAWPLEVLDVLTAEVYAILSSLDEQSVLAIDLMQHMPLIKDEDLQYLGDFWMAVAAGEIQVNDKGGMA